MSNFILVHGAWLGAWAWDGVIRHMEGSRDSHSFGEVLAVDLPGHGQRFGDEIRRITMERYVEAVVTPTEVMRLDEVVLVGHGFAGTFLPRAAMELGHRVKGMVLVGADLPPQGRSAFDRLPRWDRLMMWVFKAHEKGFRFPNLIFKKVLCDGLDPAGAEELLSRLVPEPLGPWCTAISHPSSAVQTPVTYLVLTRDKVIRPALQNRYAKSLPSARVEEIQAGHGVLFSHPGEVARALLEHV